MTDLSSSAQESHGVRSWFERWAFLVFLVSISSFVLLAVIGVIYPPSLPPAADWGKSILERVKEIYLPVLELLGTLMGPLGFSITRGHIDERLIQGK